MSDHFSGPRAIAGPAGDICDLYAFPSPERPGRLALVMTVLPGATASDVFSDAIVCRFRLRPTAIEGGGGRRRRVRPAALGWGVCWREHSHDHGRPRRTPRRRRRLRP